jgi:hypothetical protein
MNSQSDHHRDTLLGQALEGGHGHHLNVQLQVMSLSYYTFFISPHTHVICKMYDIHIVYLGLIKMKIICILGMQQ